MFIGCTKCGKLLLNIIIVNRFFDGVHLCEECAREIGINICCGKPMKVVNDYILQECEECGTFKRKGVTFK